MRSEADEVFATMQHNAKCANTKALHEGNRDMTITTTALTCSLMIRLQLECLIEGSKFEPATGVNAGRPCIRTCGSKLLVLATQLRG